MTRDMERAGLAQRTKEEYIRAVRDLAKFHHRAPDLLEPDAVRDWDDDLLRRGISPSSRSVYQSGVKFLYLRTLARPDMVACLIRPKVPHPLPRVLSLSEVGQLLSAVRKPKYRAFFALLYDTGLRVSEAANLKVGDLNLARGVIQVLGGKGGKDRQVKLGTKLLGLLRTYWRDVRMQEPHEEAFSKASLLFVSKAGGPFSVQCAQKVLRRAAQDCGLAERVTPHTLRHSFATAQLEAGTNLRVVQAQLGHSSIGSTQVYLHVATHLLLGAPSPLDALLL
jgi:site-specific recombinase XerD